MSEEMTVRVNFSRPMPLFPLSGVVTLPQQVIPLHIFEDRYRQMVAHALDGAGQIAMAVIRPAALLEYHGNPSIMPVVCVGQIEQHEKLPDGRYNILLRGICRARVEKEAMPDGERLYRLASLEPLGLDAGPAPGAEALREWLEDALDEGPLSRLNVAGQVREFVLSDEVPTPALLELVSFTMLSDASTRYRLLAEPDIDRRAKILRTALLDLSTLISRGMAQRPDLWPKGLSWN